MLKNSTSFNLFCVWEFSYYICEVSLSTCVVSTNGVVTVLIDAGSRHELPHKPGITHLLSRVAIEVLSARVYL